MPSIAGELVTETLDYDGGRQVTVYVPPDPPEAVVFAGDGQLLSQWGVVLEAASTPSTLIVGVHRLADETLRLHEYSPPFDPERFAAHERFVVDTARGWTGSRFGVTLPAERTAVMGVSAGGELALALGLRHPDVPPTGTDTGASKVPSSSTTALLCTAQSSGWSLGPTPIGSSRSCWARAPSPTSSTR